MLKGKKYNLWVKLLFILLQGSFLIAYAWNYNWDILVLVGMILTTLLLVWAYLNYHIQDIGLKLKPTLIAMFSLIAGSVLTFSLQVELNLSAVLASSGVGVLAYGIYKLSKDTNNLHIAAYCGSFIGMTNIAKASDYFTLILASVLGACIYVFARNVFNGVGGKLGSIAFISICLTLYFLL
ncbi:hypothetical protein SAMN05216474_0893 [Lishizhenia tianjinensis]|uniref:Uncharacterized protein n=1 Tax=Lishizhenia tianjinensis TaxID=477690 RepID=A0A1I6YHD7_9FLAO|nr:hypothetical protein [Lishizhenia tianjinensis]SFT49737.1 hypothetical protein SAMN05216474_0893 [Lishizhenia tianjinensis]